MESFKQPNNEQKGNSIPWDIDELGNVSSADIAEKMARNHTALMDFLAAHGEIESTPSESGETRNIPAAAIEPMLNAFDVEQEKTHRQMFQ